MSKHAKPDNGETSTSEIAKSAPGAPKSALNTEKDAKNAKHTQQSAVQSERSIAQSVEPASVEPSSVEPSIEIGGQKGLEPTRYGDWEKNGRCTDF